MGAGDGEVLGSLNPSEIQAPIIQEFGGSTEAGGILAWGVGAGKSLAGTEIARLRGARRVLIVGPSATLDGWYSTVFWQTGQTLQPVGSTAFRIAFTPDPEKRDERVPLVVTAKEAKQSLVSVQSGDDGWFFCTRELFTSQAWTKKPVIKNGEPFVDPKTGKPKMKSVRTDAWTKKRGLDILISDEHQRFANRGNRGQQAFEHADADFKLVMSADWFGSQIDNMWTVSKDTFGSERGVGGMNFPTWQDEYMTTKFTPFTFSKRETTAEKWPGFFVSTLPLYSVLPPSVEPPVPERWTVTLTNQERRAYDALEANMVAEVPDGLLVAEIPLTLRIRLRELALGLVSSIVADDGKWTIEYRDGAPSAKLDAIKEILADHAPHKFVIGSHSSKWVRWAANELRKSGIRAASRTGGESESQRRQDFDDFIEGDLRVLVCHPGTIGEGTDGMQRVCSRVILASREDQQLMNSQFLGRIARQGQPESVQAWDLVAELTYDDGVISRQMQDALDRSVAKGLKK